MWAAWSMQLTRWTRRAQDGAVAALSTLGSPLLSPQKFFLEFKAAEVYLVWFRSQRGPRRAPEHKRPGNCRESGGTVYCLAPVSPPWRAVTGEVAPEGHAGTPMLFPPLTAKAGR